MAQVIDEPAEFLGTEGDRGPDDRADGRGKIIARAGCAQIAARTVDQGAMDQVPIAAFVGHQQRHMRETLTGMSQEQVLW
ncbi:MAG: hypothetical protein IPG92_18420 [Flavobacteriales bacterium]|nr:hypothetical protein [Flavobacteriales bacterium]